LQVGRKDVQKVGQRVGVSLERKRRECRLFVVAANVVDVVVATTIEYSGDERHYESQAGDVKSFVLHR
jgi:hypothetical protein